MKKINKYFSVDDAIGKEITELEFQTLMADGKIWETSCRMNGIDAARAMNMDLSEFAIDERSYGGSIVADSLEDAEKEARKRGFGEVVKGVLCGIVPYDSTMMNPGNTTKEQLN